MHAHEGALILLDAANDDVLSFVTTIVIKNDNYNLNII